MVSLSVGGLTSRSSSLISIFLFTLFFFQSLLAINATNIPDSVSFVDVDNNQVFSLTSASSVVSTQVVPFATYSVHVTYTGGNAVRLLKVAAGTIAQTCIASGNVYSCSNVFNPSRPSGSRILRRDVFKIQTSINGGSTWDDYATIDVDCPDLISAVDSSISNTLNAFTADIVPTIVKFATWGLRFDYNGGNGCTKLVSDADSSKQLSCQKITAQGARYACNDIYSTFSRRSAIRLYWASDCINYNEYTLIDLDVPDLIQVMDSSNVELTTVDADAASTVYIPLASTKIVTTYPGCGIRLILDSNSFIHISCDKVVGTTSNTFTCNNIYGTGKFVRSDKIRVAWSLDCNAAYDQYVVFDMDVPDHISIRNDANTELTSFTSSSAQPFIIPATSTRFLVTYDGCQLYLGKQPNNPTSFLSCNLIGSSTWECTSLFGTNKFSKSDKIYMYWTHECADTPFQYATIDLDIPDTILARDDTNTQIVAYTADDTDDTPIFIIPFNVQSFVVDYPGCGVRLVKDSNTAVFQPCSKSGTTFICSNFLNNFSRSDKIRVAWSLTCSTYSDYSLLDIDIPDSISIRDASNNQITSFTSDDNPTFYIPADSHSFIVQYDGAAISWSSIDPADPFTLTQSPIDCFKSGATFTCSNIFSVAPTSRSHYIVLFWSIDGTAQSSLLIDVDIPDFISVRDNINAEIKSFTADDEPTFFIPAASDDIIVTYAGCAVRLVDDVVATQFIICSNNNDGSFTCSNILNTFSRSDKIRLYWS